MSQSQSSQQPNMDVDTMLDVYILDYLAKKKLLASAKVFEDETKVPLDVQDCLFMINPAIDAPRGFLYEWWTIFWDVFVSRHRHNQGAMEPCDQAFRIQQYQQQQQQSGQHQSQNVNVNNPWMAEASNTTRQRQMYGDNAGIQMNQNTSLKNLLMEHQKQALDMDSLIYSLANQNAQARQALLSGAHAARAGVSNNMPLKGWPMTRDQIKALQQQQQQQGALHPPSAILPKSNGGSDMDSLIYSLANQNAQARQALLSGAHAARAGVSNNMPLKGWPMTRDQIKALQQQQQQQGALHPPQLSYRNQMEGQFQAPNERNITQIERQFQPSNENTISQMEGQFQAPHERNITQIERQFQPLNENKISQMEGQFQPSNERKRSQIEGQVQPLMEKRRKHPLTSADVANSSGTTNAMATAFPCSTESMPGSPHNDKINIDEYLNYGALDGKEPEVDTTSSNGFTFLEIGSIHATSVNCCDISFDGKLVAIGGQDKKATLWCTNSRETKATLDGHSQAITDIRFSPSMLRLATSSQDKTVRIWDLENATLWCTNSRETKATLDGHSQAITDIRFSPSMLRLATSSQDKTVRIWDLENPGSLIRTLTGHTASVMSLDFHPKKEDCICSCDENEIRFWTIMSAGCTKVSKGGASLVRFQSGSGKHLAGVIGKSVVLVDLENPQGRKHALKGHGTNVQSICWDASGENLVSVSEDLIKVWRLDSGGKANCIRQLNVTGKRFCCGTFHPCYPSLLIIGCHEGLGLWNMAENKLLMPMKEPVYALAVSKSMSGLIVSAGHNDNAVKLWK
ncbi:transcriptional corepressor LEUNIG-like protein isoform X2 [Tanacetum coccineum]